MISLAPGFFGFAVILALFSFGDTSPRMALDIGTRKTQNLEKRPVGNKYSGYLKSIKIPPTFVPRPPIQDRVVC